MAAAVVHQDLKQLEHQFISMYVDPDLFSVLMVLSYFLWHNALPNDLKIMIMSGRYLASIGLSCQKIELN